MKIDTTKYEYPTTTFGYAFLVFALVVLSVAIFYQ